VGVRGEASPDGERLAELHAGAAALIHPSLYEGFGMTVLEAMHLGTPVIAARNAGVVEVAGDAARYVEPRDADALARAMAELAASDALRRELAERGRRRASEFSWAASARAHLSAYSLAVRHR
jgi:glycosyltransferase involved in cell wall biosynthesis